jgi:two-component system cell cycle sensor histidine kinase/response regulator CckA
MIGRTPEETAGVSILNLYVEADHARIITRLAEADQSGEAQFEARMIRTDGQTFPVQIDVVSVRGGDGQLLYRVATAQDITQRKQLEEQFFQSQKMDAIGKLAGGVAHDFNNLLSVILGNASLMQMDGSPTEEQTASLQEIERAAERAANLTRQLLAFSRRQVMTSRPLDLNEIAASTTKMLQRLIGENIALQTQFAPEGAHVHADPGMMEQVLLNLAINARDAMPEAGEIFIRTELVHLPATSDDERLKNRTGDFVRLSLRDTGVGIAPEHLPRIFEPFFTTKEIGKGTGLGLATVFGIIEQHQGWIEVASELGRGTTFHIFLPCLPKSARQLVEKIDPPTVRGGHETILVVEDEGTLRALTCNALERYGYRVLEARSGAAALEVWRDHHESIDLLLTDLVMPEGVSGRELAERVRVEKPQLKVVYMSGYPGDVAGKTLHLREGVNFLQKPYSPLKLAQIVRQRLDQPES